VLNYNSIIQVLCQLYGRQITVNPRWLKSFACGAKNGYEIFNPIFVLLISYKFTTFIMKIMFGILKHFKWFFVNVKAHYK